MSSFSSDLKNELARIPIKEELEIIELSAFLRVSGSIIFSGEVREIIFPTTLSATARRLTTFLRHISQSSVEVSVSKTPNLKKLNTYRISLVGIDACKRLIELTKFGDFPFSYEVPELKKSDEKRAYLRAAFLASGSVTTPEKAYHLEILSEKEEQIQGILKLFEEFQISSKIIQRRGKFLLYMKSSQMISDAIQVFGAVNTLFHFEDIRALKEFKNVIVRQVNCDSHNVDRIIQASLRQRRAIELLAARGILKDLPPKLKEAASLRMENPEDSFSALASMCEPKTNRQEFARRLNKLEKLAKENR